MLGLDIGTYSIKAVRLKKEGDSYQVLAVSRYERPQKEPLQASLKNFFEKARLDQHTLINIPSSPQEVAVGVSGNAVVARLVEMPAMSDEELKNAMRFEAEKNTPFPMEGAVLDYQIVTRDAGTKKTRVLFAAAKRESATLYIEQLKELGCIVKCIDVDSIAVTNAFAAAVAPKNGGGCALINIGDAFTNMSIVSEGVAFLLRDIGISGKDLAEDIAKGMGVSRDEAYQLKHSFPADKQAALLDAVRPTMDKLAREARLSVGYFENQFAKGVEVIYISGGSARLFGLKDFLSKALNVSVEAWNPLSCAKAPSAALPAAADESGVDLAVAVGLALRDD